MHRGIPSIAVVGSCNVDLIAYVDRVPEAGETVIGRDFAMGFGGKGANQAVMAARLGAAVEMIGALGDDLYAEMTLRNFDDERVGREAIASVPRPSGVAPIWVQPDGMNRIVVVPGANEHVDRVVAARRVAECVGLDVVLGQLEIPQAVTLSTFEAARARDAITVLNPAPAAPLDPRLLAATDWLIPNEIELDAIRGTGAADDDDRLAELQQSVQANLVVTLGARGAAVVVDGRVSRLPAPDVPVVDTTGAGDAFVGAFGVGLALGLSPLDACRLGIACASDSVTRRGTQASFPDRQRATELRAWVAAGGR